MSYIAGIVFLPWSRSWPHTSIRFQGMNEWRYTSNVPICLHGVDEADSTFTPFNRLWYWEIKPCSAVDMVIWGSCLSVPVKFSGNTETIEAQKQIMLSPCRQEEPETLKRRYLRSTVSLSGLQFKRITSRVVNDDSVTSRSGCSVNEDVIAILYTHTSHTAGLEVKPLSSTR